MLAHEEKNLLRDKCHQRRGRWLWYRSVSWVLCWVLSRVLKFQLASWGSWFEAIQGDTAPTPASPGKRCRCWLIKVFIMIMIVAQLIMNVKILWMEKMGRRSQPLLWDTSVLAEFFSSALFSMIHLSLAYRGKQRPPGVENPEGKGVLKKDIVSKNMTHCRFWCWSFHLDHCLYCHLFGDLAPDK